MELKSKEALKVAREVMAGGFMAEEEGRPGLLFWMEDFWVWKGRRWERTDEGVIHDRVFRLLEDATVATPTATGGTRVERYAPNESKVREVVAGLRSLVRAEWRQTPCWTDTGVSPETCVGFDDVVADLQSDVVVERDSRWFDPSVMPWKCEGGAECPRWKRALKEWGNGDERWEKLAQMWAGYCLMWWRAPAKIMLLYGVTRAGKGVYRNVIKGLVGRHCFWEASVKDLAGNFGLDGAERAKVFSSGEIGKLNQFEKSQVSVVLKSMLGGDEMTVNGKFKRPIRGVRCRAAPMLSSNEMPQFDNAGDSMTSKMVILPFERSFRDCPELGLEAALEREMSGIAQWAVEGARMVLRGEEWPLTTGGEAVLKTYRLMNNPMDWFLEARFVKVRDGFVEHAMLCEEWENFRSENGIQDKVSWNQLGLRLENESSWGVRRHRKRVGENVVRGVRGLRLRREADDLQ